MKSEPTHPFRAVLRHRTAFALSAALIVLAPGIVQADTTNASPRDTSIPDPGSYQIRSKQFGRLLRPLDANNADGVRIVLYPGQPWKCMTWKLSPTTNATFLVRNHFTAKTFSAATASGDSPTRVVQTPMPSANASTPDWQLTRLPDGSYRIIDPKSKLALTAAQGQSDGSPQVILSPWRDNDGQKWELEKIDPSQLTM